MTVPENHNFTIERRTEKAFVGKPIRFRAECSCGWVGEWRREKRDAEGDGLSHQAVVQPPDLDEAA